MKRNIPDRGDILHINLNPAQGAEQQGARPILVLTLHEFNRLGLVLACPISQSGNYARDKGFAVSLTGIGCDTQGVVLCHQLRTLDYRVRQARFIESLPNSITAEVIARVQTLLD